MPWTSKEIVGPRRCAYKRTSEPWGAGKGEVSLDHSRQYFELDCTLITAETEPWQWGQKTEVEKILRLVNLGNEITWGGAEFVVPFHLTVRVRIPVHCARELEFIPKGWKKEGNNHTSHRFPDLSANILSALMAVCPRHTRSSHSMTDQSTYTSLPWVMENGFNFQNQQMFNGAVQGCCSVMAHWAYATWGMIWNLASLIRSWTVGMSFWQCPYWKKP